MTITLIDLTEAGGRLVAGEQAYECQTDRSVAFGTTAVRLP
jgi:hypothetical protein